LGGCKIMGMFDTITCNYPLPLPLEVIDIIPDIYDQEIQTKCLDCFMEQYILEEDGVLYKDFKKYEWKDDDSHFLKGYLDVIESNIAECNYHGMVNFYIYERILDKENKDKGVDVTIDYIAKFTGGRLDFIELKDYSITDASEHILNTKKFFKDLETFNNKWFNKYLFKTKPILYIRRKIYRALYSLHNFTGKLHSLAIKYL
jgi:hypothetical protein